VDDPVPGIILQGNWFMMVDPAWDVSTQSAVPTEMMVGGWARRDDGTTGPFRPNPGYRPSAETVPTDPIDALLRQITADTSGQLGDELLAMVRDSIIAIGCDELDQPLIGTGPDGKRCVVAATAEVQKTGIDVDRWRSVHGAKLSSIVPTGTGILLNPAGSAPFRLARFPT
jgi:hypothetical protein